MKIRVAQDAKADITLNTEAIAFNVKLMKIASTVILKHQPNACFVNSEVTWDWTVYALWI